ncbi:Na+/H+ antiporter NhaA [Rickettsiales bacterium]|nr:Na+/H+ antiporter NhaA [Rickettsiales bacterium]MDB2550238.1 Na+/H+ antiporter NhaA [Rickettsiales bacterium]
MKSLIKNFFKSDSSSGIILLLFAILAMICVNSPLRPYYESLLNTNFNLNLSFIGIFKEMTIKLWVDDALMAIFFFLIGIELKHEVVNGELSNRSAIIKPLIAAVGGVVVPALIFAHINNDFEQNMRGWAIPTATDIAFAIGVLNLFGNKVPKSLKIFLVALAVIDDLVAIIIIAIFYSDNISIIFIELSCVIYVLLFILNRKKITNLVPYLILGVILWVFVLKSGVHATIAGVTLAMFLPTKIKNKKGIAPLYIVESALHKPVNYIILPIFAFASAGIVFENIALDILCDPLVLGIIMGLFVGKQVGVISCVILISKLKIAKFFKDANILQFYGVSTLTGIGFTMSLFIGNLAFVDPYILNKVRIGVMVASALSAILGAFLIYMGNKKAALKS